MYLIRSTIFNLAFYGLTAIACIAFLPALLMPDKVFLKFVHVYLKLMELCEKAILGLSYEIRGHEHLPDKPPYIIASKHQSAYETLKLRFLFDHPAIILKKELLSLPLWGAYLKRSDVIAIDRSTPDSALQSIEDGARRVKDQNRPIIIFPQGTRVRIDQTAEEKPYKKGVHHIQQATNLPIIPMALNTGYFWPRNAWLKKPGKVIFEFLPPIKPGLDKKPLLAKLTRQVETASNALLEEAKQKEASRKNRAMPWLAALCLITFLAYSGWWMVMAERVATVYSDIRSDLDGAPYEGPPPNITGYPFAMHLHIPSEILHTSEGTLEIKDLRATGWPFPALPVHVETGPLKITARKWENPLRFENFAAKIKYFDDILTVLESELHQTEFTATATGQVDFNQKPTPKFDLLLKAKNHPALIEELVKQKIIKSKDATLAQFALMLFMKDGQLELPLRQKGNKLYAGSFPIVVLPSDKNQKQRPPSRRKRVIPTNPQVQSPAMNPSPDPDIYNPPAPVQ